MIGQFIVASSRTATRSAVTAGIVGALILSATSANRALAQVPVSDTVRTDTTNNLVMSADTTQEVKHVVKKGDTLWDLANTYLKNPFRWPEIFRRNTDVVENPHWIYPGEVIRIWGHEVKPEALARADSAGEVVSHIETRAVQQQARPTGTPSDLTVFASPMSRAAAEQNAANPGTAGAMGRTYGGGVRRGEVEAAPYVDRNGGPRDAGRLVASVDRPGIKTSIVQSRYQINDDLYVDLPRGLEARLGDLYMSYVMGPVLEDGGQVVIPTGILRIESLPAGQRPLARIVRQFGEIRLGEKLITAPDISFPTGALSPVAGGMRGKVIYVHNEPVLPSIGHYVVISPSSKNGVSVGDRFMFVDNSTGREDENPAPAVSAGEAQIVRVTPYASTAIIISQIQPTIRDGMPVRMTGKMP